MVLRGVFLTLSTSCRSAFYSLSRQVVEGGNVPQEDHRLHIRTD